MVMVQY